MHTPPYALRSGTGSSVEEPLELAKRSSNPEVSWLGRTGLKAAAALDPATGAIPDLKAAYIDPSPSFLKKLAVTGGILGIVYKGVSIATYNSLSHGSSSLAFRLFNRLAFGENLQRSPGPFKFALEWMKGTSTLPISEYVPSFIRDQIDEKADAELLYAEGYLRLVLFGAAVLVTGVAIQRFCSKKQDPE